MEPTIEQYRSAAKRLIQDRDKNAGDLRMLVPAWGTVAKCSSVAQDDGPGAFVDVTIWVREEEASREER